MAYPTVSAAYGYKPVNLIGGQVFAGSTREYPIAYNYGTAIYNGDPVTLTAGYATIATVPVTTTNTTVGVFLGCYYTNPTTKQRLYSQFYPGNVTAGDITAIVSDDPDVVIRCAVTAAAGSTAIASASSILVGQNMAGNTLTGSVSTGNGAGAVIASTNGLTVSGAGFRVLGLVPDTQVETAGTYSSGTGTTTLGLTGLPASTTFPLGTDVFNLVNGQLQFTGSTLTSAGSSNASGVASLTVTASTVAVSGTVVLVQTPEVLVKWNFGAHRYYVA